MSSKQRLVVGVSGATGAIYARRLLERLQEHGGVETHLVISPPGVLTIKHELGMSRSEFSRLADHVHIGGIEATTDDACYRAMDWLVAVGDEVGRGVFDAVAHLLNLEVDLLFFDSST